MTRIALLTVYSVFFFPHQHMILFFGKRELIELFGSVISPFSDTSENLRLGGIENRSITPFSLLSFSGSPSEQYPSWVVSFIVYITSIFNSPSEDCGNFTYSFHRFSLI